MYACCKRLSSCVQGSTAEVFAGCEPAVAAAGWLPCVLQSPPLPEPVAAGSSSRVGAAFSTLLRISASTRSTSSGPAMRGRPGPREFPELFSLALMSLRINCKSCSMALHCGGKVGFRLGDLLWREGTLACSTTRLPSNIARRHWELARIAFWHDLVGRRNGRSRRIAGRRLPSERPAGLNRPHPQANNPQSTRADVLTFDISIPVRFRVGLTRKLQRRHRRQECHRFGRPRMSR